MSWEDEDQEPVEAVLDRVIAQMDAFVQDMPLTAHLRPYTNSYAPGMVYPAIVLTDLFADRPGAGAGTVYLSELGRRCDEEGLTLYTDAEGKRSFDFYVACGFEATTGRRDHQLVRWAPMSPDLAAAIAAASEPGPSQNDDYATPSMGM